MPAVCLVIPCFNEATRLPRDSVRQVLRESTLVANDLRVEQATLDDAYLALTARPTKELS